MGGQVFLAAFKRAPASVISFAATSLGGLGERRVSKRSSTALVTLLTFCPPGPDAHEGFGDLALIDEEIVDFHRISASFRNPETKCLKLAD